MNYQIEEVDELLELETRDSRNTEFYSLNNHEYTCKCVSVYDGDTITIVVKPYSLTKFYKYNIRLMGIDTPEIKTNSLNEKNKAILARDFLRDIILNKILKIRCGKFDKYGRLLGCIYTNDGVCVNDLLIRENLAYDYSGGKKTKFSL